VEAVAIDGDADLECARRFAPGAQNLPITYEFRRGEGLRGAEVGLNIKDRNNHVIYTTRVIGLGADRRETFDWNGRDDHGNLVTPLQSPFTVTLWIGRNVITRTRHIRVEIGEIHIWTRVVNNRVNMSPPTRKLEAAATVMIKRANGTLVPAHMPLEVKFSFTRGGRNIPKNDSFEYVTASHLRLGKRNDANAVYWEAHARSTAATDDAWKRTARAQIITTGADRGKAFIWFKPSGVGGDTFTVKGTVYDADGTTVLKEEASPVFTIWRKITLPAYEMHHTGQRHVSRNGTNAIMRHYYSGDTFTEYALGRVTAIRNAYCVKYIGLWNHATTSSHNWNTQKRKSAANNEVPTAAQINDSALAGATPADVAKRNTARTRIQACADRWRDRIINAYNSGIQNWASDAGIPVNSIVAIEYEHPKYSAAAPDGDSITNEWSDPKLAWLTITVEGHNIHPDQRWINGQGLSSGRRAYITAGMSRARTRVTIAHEAGHETKNQFKRANFRPASVGGRPEDSDHTPPPGLMDWVASRSRFTRGEKRVLRGVDNP